jgi:hypothetical protein
MKPIILKLLNKSCETFLAHPFTVPRSVSQQLLSEIGRFVDVGVQGTYCIGESILHFTISTKTKEFSLISEFPTLKTLISYAKDEGVINAMEAFTFVKELYENASCTSVIHKLIPMMKYKLIQRNQHFC